MDRNEWIRDLVFYVIALSTLIFFGMTETITYTKSIIFLMIYLIYIGVIIYQIKTTKLSPEKRKARTLRNEQGKMNKMIKKYLKDDTDTKSYLYSKPSTDEDTGTEMQTTKLDIDSELKPDDEFMSADNTSELINEGEPGHVLEDYEVRDINMDQLTHTLKQERWQNIVNRTMKTLSVAEFKKILKEEQVEEQEEIPFGEMTTWGKVSFLILYPFEWMCALTIPPVEEEKLTSKWVFLYPLSTTFMVITLNDWWDGPLFGMSPQFVLAVISLIFCPICLFFSKMQYYGLLGWTFVGFAFICSISWLSYSAGIIVDIIKVS